VRQTFRYDELGYVCLWAFGSGEGAAPDTCISVRPYVYPRDDVQSIDNAQVDVCGLAATTCEGLVAFSATPCASDDACGLAGEDDGLCGVLAVGTNRCTLPCASSIDCLPDYACNIGAAKPACDQQPNRCYVAADCRSDKPICDTNSNTCKPN
jgi:hypothetical protein